MLRLYSQPLLASFFVASALFTNLATAQTILPTAADASFPQCALSCPLLLQAQTDCLPPAAPYTDQYVYSNCFCTSALLTQLHTSPDGTCDQSCTVESDRGLLENWYASYCTSLTASSSQPAATSVLSSLSSSLSSAPVTVTSGVSTVIVILPQATSSSTSASPTVTGSGATLGSTSSSNNSWIHTHWRWILMLGILLLGLAIIAFLAICLKRRHRRKLDEKRATLSGFPARPPSGRNRTPTPSLGAELWGPHQHMAHTRGWEYNHEQDKPVASDVVFAAERKNKKIRRDPSEKGGSRGVSRHATSVREVDSGAPSILSEMGNVQRRRDREQEREREKSRDQYAEYRSQSMKGAVSAFERDRDRDREQRSQTMREQDRIAWRDRDPEKMDTIEKI